MAAQEAQLERKLRPVYDSIDSGQLKTALKSVNALLQKHPDFALAGALRAVVLQRSGKAEEAVAAAAEVARLVPTEEHVLHTLNLVWKATGNTAVRARHRCVCARVSRLTHRPSAGGHGRLRGRCERQAAGALASGRAVLRARA